MTTGQKMMQPKKIHSTKFDLNTKVFLKAKNKPTRSFITTTSDLLFVKPLDEVFVLL